MADLIAKIGRFFAEQEAQLQQTHTQALQTQAHVPSHTPVPPAVHRVPIARAAASLPLGRRDSATDTRTLKPPRSLSLVRRRLSFQPAVDELFASVQSSNVVSWPSSSPTVSTASSGSLDQDEDLASSTSSASRDKPRSAPKVRKRTRRKKRGVTAANPQADTEKRAKENAKKVEAALALAQERAKRIQQEKLQLEREKERGRLDEALRVQQQMTRIEVVRASSFRSSPHSTPMTTPRSSRSPLTGCEAENDKNSAVEATNVEPQSRFLGELEAQLRERVGVLLFMSLEMRVKESCVDKHQQRERIRSKLTHVLEDLAAQQSKMSRLSAAKTALEQELASVREDGEEMRSQRRQLEQIGKRERARRLREAERELQIRLREEEWRNMMDEEKARCETAAEARVKAGKRVEAHSINLQKMLQSYRYEPRRPVSNNSSNHENGASSPRNDSETRSEPSGSLKLDLLLPLELAEFEEDGICSDLEANQATSCRWQIPPFPDTTRFNEILFNEMLSPLLLTLFAGTAFAALTNASEKCNYPSIWSVLQVLDTDPSYVTCQMDANYTLSSTRPPSGVQGGKLCSSAACQALLKQTLAMELPACQMVVSGFSFNLSDVVAASASKCLPQGDSINQERAKGDSKKHSKIQHIVDVILIPFI
ncbi:hypothetical protein BBJ28_00003850 [Nothophytophthora sp. Chile5]|nr:hypothetical protein BBJ28_00003850 [Nothophytophthora sp. Chile5]